MLLLVYGLRRGEVPGLRWRDGDDAGGEIRVRQQVQPINKEAASPPLTSRARRAGYGAAPPAPRVLRIALRATALRAALDPGDLCNPWRQEERAGPGLPPPDARRANPAVAGLRLGSAGQPISSWRDLNTGVVVGIQRLAKIGKSGRFY